MQNEEKQAQDPDRLIQACHQDPAAFRELVEMYKTRMYSFLIHLAGKEAADDLFQEVWLRVYKAAPRYEPRGKAISWLFKIANNLAIRQYGKWSREKAIPMGDALAAKPSSDPDPAQVVAAEEGHGRVQAAIQALPEEQRQVFLLRQYGDLSFKEIALELDVPLGTALSRMNAALEKLRAKLGDPHA